MEKTSVILLHLGYWIIYLVLLAVTYATVSLQLGKTQVLPDPGSIVPATLLFITPNLFGFYASYFFLFPRFLARKKITALFVLGAVGFLAAMIGGLVTISMLGIDQAIFNNRRAFWGFVLSQSILTVANGTVALVIRGFLTWYSEIKLKEEL